MQHCDFSVPNLAKAMGALLVVPVPTGALKWDNGGKLVTIEMHDVPVIDQPKWPAHGAQAR